MPIYVHISEECIRDAQNNGQFSKLESLRKSVIKTQSLAGFKEFTPSDFQRKSLGHNYRLLAYRASVSDDQLILFLRVLPRGGHEYKNFLRNWSYDIEKTKKKLQIPKQDKLEKIHADLNKTSPAQPLSPPDCEEEKWLYVIQAGGKFEKEEIPETANFALSPEEAKLLKNIRNPQISSRYPLFINGRAGSGKSTILQYLAADYVDFALHNSLEGLLYMTCSSDLLKRAKETVTKRLESGGEKPPQESIVSVLNRSFQVFHDFLRGLLPREKQEALSEDRYVNYAKFQRLWKKDFAKRQEAHKFSVAVSWHVIRSYIKGVQNDDLIPEEFESLPQKRRSVSIEDYKRIYSDVWSRWYQRLCKKEGYWDDQDLASLVLESGVTKNGSYKAVFCDEAQDFTPVELDIIFQLSVFSMRSLQPEQLRCVPFIFAGDPLQTINPTGFQWSAVKANFNDRFRAVLDSRRVQQIPDMNYQELHVNYRSNPGIVKFCNLIQFSRAALPGSGDIKPQKAWRMDNPAQVVWFVAGNDKTTEQLRQNPGLVKLVDCHDGGETDYVEGDRILREALRDIKAEGDFLNVFGPDRAKGLEFSSVVLFRFGENAPDIIAEYIEGNIDLNDSEKRLRLEYFFNRLYVAASRAKDHLIIVDSEKAIGNFWSFATASDFPENLKELPLRPKDIGCWLKDDADDSVPVANIFPGEEDAWNKPIDLHEQAKDYERQGRDNRDSFLMRQAGGIYRIADQLSKASECFAAAAEFEGKYDEAGDKYYDIGEYGKAIRCYWKSENWRRLTAVAAIDHSLTQGLPSLAADFMKGRKIPDRIFLDRLGSAAIEDSQWLRNACGDSTWQKVITEVARRLSGASDTANEIPWAQVDEIFNRFVDKGVPIEDSCRGTIAYFNGDFAKAVNLWEHSGNTQANEYWRAKAQIAPFPECLPFWVRCRDYAKALDIWRIKNLNQSAIKKTDKKVIQAVTEAAIELKDFQLATDLLLNHNIPPNMMGAAIKRAGKIVDALQYYEDLKGAAAKQEKCVAERLVYNLEQHADILKKEGRKQQQENQERRAKYLRSKYDIPDSAPLKKYSVIRTPKEKDFLQIETK